MLISGIFSSPYNFDIVQNFYKLCLAIDSIIYNVIGWMYSVFMSIAGARIFTSDIIIEFSTRMYMIVSIVMLFVVAYTFLTVIINPDNLTKGKLTPAQLVKNIMLSLICIVFIPTIFNFAYAVQNSIVTENILGKVVLGVSQTSKYDNASGDFPAAVFESTYYLNDDIPSDSDAIEEYEIADLNARSNGDISAFADTIDYVSTGEIQYNFILSAIVGGFILYTLLIFSIDLGLRAVKLAFYELIAPIPSLMLIVPGQNKIFSSWLKEVLKTFLEVFVKIIVMVFGVYFIYVVDKAFDSGKVAGFFTGSIHVARFAKLFIIIGIVLFIKQLPKLLGDIFGIRLEGPGLSLRKRFDEIKEAVAPVTNFASRAAGAVVGAHLANRAYKQGVNQGNSNTGIKKALATFHGLRNGFNGGIGNVGAAYNYEMETQRSYALDSDKTTFEQIRNASGDMLRDNFGFQTRYEDYKRLIQIKRDRELAPYREDIKNIEDKTSQVRSMIDEGHRLTLNDNKAVNDMAVKLDDDVSAECMKEDSKIFSSNSEMINEFTKKHNDDLIDIDNKLKTATGAARQDLINERNKTLAEMQYLELCNNVFTRDNTLNSELNSYGMQKELELVDLNEGGKYSAAEQNALRFFLKSGQDLNKVKYLESGNLTSKIDLDIQNLKLAVGKQNAGKTMIARKDKDGVILGYEMGISTDFKSMVDDSKKILKLKKESGILLDTENKIKNDELSNSQVTVVIDDKEVKSNLYELSDILQNKKDYVEKVNKEVERRLEAYKDQEQILDIKKSRDKSTPKHSAKHNK